jgi:hypothetical protein
VKAHNSTANGAKSANIGGKSSSSGADSSSANAFSHQSHQLRDVVRDYYGFDEVQMHVFIHVLGIEMHVFVFACVCICAFASMPTSIQCEGDCVCMQMKVFFNKSMFGWFGVVVCVPAKKGRTDTRRKQTC